MERSTVERNGAIKKNIKRVAAYSSLVVLSGCGLNDCNPANSVTVKAKPDSQLVAEINHNFPGASNIKVVHASDNPNEVIWDMPNGQYCTATGAQTFSREDTPGELVTEPYCRPGTNPTQGQ